MAAGATHSQAVRPLKIGIVAGEMSGDILGADLMDALLAVYTHIEFSGIGGSRMLAAGFNSLYPQDRLAVMGLVEPLKRLPELLRIRSHLRRYFIGQQFDLVIGIDSPDFNLALECSLKAAGIKTAHYVSPSVWAWRKGRIKTIARGVDMMLTLFPFEEAFYRQHDVPVTCVGHPLADEIAPQDRKAQARITLNIDPPSTVIALMPGSRGGEVGLLLPDFLRAADLIYQQRPEILFLIAAANADRRQQIDALLSEIPPRAQITVIDGESQNVMAAADTILMASGTATLEAMLLGRPMVVAYRMHWLSWMILSRIVKVDYFALPNLLARKELVPELAQHAVQPPKLAELLLRQLDDEDYRSSILAAFRDMHLSLRRNAGATAAKALAPLLECSGDGEPGTGDPGPGHD